MAEECQRKRRAEARWTSCQALPAFQDVQRKRSQRPAGANLSASEKEEPGSEFATPE